MSGFLPCASSLWLLLSSCLYLKDSWNWRTRQKDAGVQFFCSSASLCGHKRQQPASFELIITPCIILKINVISHCWCMHLNISREPLFAKTDKYNCPGCVTLCTSRVRHITSVVTVNTTVSHSLQHGKCEYLSMCMFSIRLHMASCICMELEKVNAPLGWPQSNSVK